MARPCSVCTHPDREEIDLLLAALATSSPLNISRRFGLSISAVKNHKANHLTYMLFEATAPLGPDGELPEVSAIRSISFTTTRRARKRRK